MATPRSGVSSKCAATSLTFHFGETVCFSQSSGARERNRSRSRPSSLENKWAVRIGGNGLMAVFMDEPGPGRILTSASVKSNAPAGRQKFSGAWLLFHWRVKRHATFHLDMGLVKGEVHAYTEAPQGLTMVCGGRGGLQKGA